ncbi:MAG TPA: diaminopimelate decarboxylase [Chthoniobacterales bacterium]|nr:diaminopimelate decarboxylase [Chthoniobacterales bacterium]
MHSFHYQQGRLYCESTELAPLAEEHGTPLYVYSEQTILDHYRRLNGALEPLDREICYAVKANSNLAILRILAEEGAGFDIVSGGELYRIITAGADPAQCTFAGVGKTRDEIAYALYNNIGSFNIESEEELLAIEEVASSLDRTAPIAVRVNPDVDAKTHKYISTGKSENKFGIGLDRVEAVYEMAAGLKHLELKGLQTHIGSQITEPKPFADAIDKIVPVAQHLRNRFGIEFFSIGGGIGIVYRESLKSGDQAWWQQKENQAMSIEEYAGTIVPRLQPLRMRVLLEPGRFLVGNAGVLLTRVLYRKQTPNKVFIIVDVGMNDLIRPALYQGYHEIVPLNETANLMRADVVGPVCETGDFIALDREIADVKAGDLLAIMSAGAYGFSMASNYNSRPLAAEVLVQGKTHQVIRRRQNYADLVQLEIDAAHE